MRKKDEEQTRKNKKEGWRGIIMHEHSRCEKG